MKSVRDICKEKVKENINDDKTPWLVKFLKEIYDVKTLEEAQDRFVDDALKEE